MQAEIQGAGALQKAQHLARYGHRDWLWWSDGENEYADRKTAANIKKMLMTVGLKRSWALVTANDGCPMMGFWAMGLNILRQARRGI